MSLFLERKISKEITPFQSCGKSDTESPIYWLLLSISYQQDLVFSQTESDFIDDIGWPWPIKPGWKQEIVLAGSIAALWVMTYDVLNLHFHA